MAVLIRNQLAADYVGAAIGILGITPPLNPKGQDGSFVDITSEIVGLTNAEYDTLNNEQASGKVLFTKESTDFVETPGLVIQSAEETFDTARVPRGGAQTPSSPVFFDAQTLPKKTVLVDAAGAADLDFFGSIDLSNGVLEDKRYRYLGRMSVAEPGLQDVPGSIAGQLNRYKFFKVNLVRGEAPLIQFLAMA